MLRVGPAAYERALSQPLAREMDFTGRPLKGMIYVSAEGVATDASLQKWVDMAAQFAGTLPAKGKSKSAAKKRPPHLAPPRRNP
jgi:hypothetical protein